MRAQTPTHQARTRAEPSPPRAQGVGEGGDGSALAEQRRLLDNQTRRVQAAAERLRRQPDAALRVNLAAELRLQERLEAGLAEGLETLRERARAERELARARAFLGAVEADRARRVEGDERRALIAEVRAKLSPRASAAAADRG